MAKVLAELLKLVSGVTGGAVGITAMAAAYGGVVVYLLTTQGTKYCFSILELSGLGVVVAVIAHFVRR